MPKKRAAKKAVKGAKKFVFRRIRGRVVPIRIKGPGGFEVEFEKVINKKRKPKSKRPKNFKEAVKMGTKKSGKFGSVIVGGVIGGALSKFIARRADKLDEGIIRPVEEKIERTLGIENTNKQMKPAPRKPLRLKRRGK